MFRERLYNGPKAELDITGYICLIKKLNSFTSGFKDPVLLCRKTFINLGVCRHVVWFVTLQLRSSFWVKIQYFNISNIQFSVLTGFMSSAVPAGWEDCQEEGPAVCSDCFLTFKASFWPHAFKVLQALCHAFLPLLSTHCFHTTILSTHTSH